MIHMKKLIIALTGGLLFLAGYYQARRQTEYMTTKMGNDIHMLPAKPMVLPQKRSLLAFSLSKSFLTR